MTKSLSEQLCELAGIKPRYGLWINIGDLDKNYVLETNERKYRLIADHRWHVDSEEDLKNLKPEFYPDFESPENFVKLLGILHKEKHIVLDFNFFDKQESLVQQVITCVIGIIEKVPTFIAKDLKQAITDTEWKY